MALKKGSTSLFRKSPKTISSSSKRNRIPLGVGLSQSIGSPRGSRKKRKSTIVLGMAAVVAFTYSCHTFFGPSGPEGSHSSSQLAGMDAAEQRERLSRSNVRDDLPDSVAEQQTARALDRPTADDESRRVWRYYLPGSIGSKAIVAKLYHDSCKPDATTGKTRLHSVSLWFRSPAGRHQADFQLTPAPLSAGTATAASGAEKGVSTVTVADTSFKLNSPLPADIDRLCGLLEADDNNSQFPIDQPTVAVAMALIGQIAPQCKMSFDRGQGLTCGLTGRAIRGLETKLSVLQRNILNHSKRHPYLMVRRISVALLASRLADGRLSPQRFASERRNLCNILSYSLPLELPLVMRTPVVKSSVCAAKAKRKEIAPLMQVIAADAYREIDGVFQVYKSSSRIGKVSLRLKGERKIGRHLWMELTPVLERSNGPRSPAQLATNSGIGSGAGSGLNGFSFGLDQCFHPLYSASSPIYVDYVSQLLPVDASCTQLLPSEGDPLAYARYRHEAISSETEFAISNGWSKVLNLPPGKYRYEIRPKKARVGNNSPKNQGETVTGVIEWAAKKPNVLIR